MTSTATVRDELAAIGVRPRATDRSGADSLTPSERRVAELAEGAARMAMIETLGARAGTGAAQLEGLEEMPKLLSSLHAAEHSLIALLPLWAMCDRWDIGGLSTNLHFQTGRPTVFVYDGHAGGVGITERGFERFEGWVEDTAKMLAGEGERELEKFVFHREQDSARLPSFRRRGGRALRGRTGKDPRMRAAFESRAAGIRGSFRSRA